ncbi:Protein tyrosine phosphatase [Mactra antiquata]
MFLLTLIVLFVCGISSGIAQDLDCRTNCACCNSNPDTGSRELPDICNSQIGNWACTYGCKDGYYGGKCYNKCPEYCTRCAREFGASHHQDYQICYICAEGYYNGTWITNCSTPCPTNCAENQCDKTTGNCLHGCKSNKWSGDKCKFCADTWYGYNCNTPCPSNCKDRLCHDNGSCSNGCSDERFIGLQCNQCRVGKTGDNCDEICPVNCLGDVCGRNDGTCTNGCKGNFRGDRCDMCAENYYGSNCDEICNNCLNGLCDRSTGICIDCVNGKYGELCDKSCSTGCKNSVCIRNTAVCSQECKSGYSGDKCCVNNNGCEECDTTNTCSKCADGNYGNSCEKTCPVNCTGACNKETGNCESCKEEKFYGVQCGTQCPANCLDGKCAKEDGKCSSCKISFHGNTCTDSCPDTCIDNVCGQDDGICNNCTVGFHGDKCDIPCRTDCINNTCIQGSGVCAFGCVNGCEEAPPPSPSITGPAIGGAIGGLVVIALIVVGVWFILRRRRSQQEVNKKYTADINTPVTATDDGHRTVYENCDSLMNRDTRPSPAPVVESKNKPDFHDIAQVPAVPEPEEAREKEEQIDDDYYTFRNVINVVDLPSYVKHKAGEHLVNEFKRLAKGLKQPCTVARKSENIALNRYNGLYPYDHSRVKLPHDKKFFINACYVKGNQQQKAYIASLGPTRVTTENYATFWKMVWYEKSDVIVMLTNLQEPSGMKCERYWPELGQSLTFPHLEIKCDSVEDFSEYTLRAFTVTKGKERRTVNQLHFTAWPDKSIPNNVTSLVEFRQRVKSTHTLSQGPVVVHCSAGIGRTGTYIAIDLLTEEGLTEGSVDVFGCIRNMREQRVNMVQTPDQYEYVHRAIVYTLTLDVDYTPTETFNEYVMSLSDAQYGAMFKKLSTSVEHANEENEQAITANKRETNKNRPGSDIPGNENRPRLYLNRSFNDPNYINAVYIDGFKRRNRFILAQTPLSSTLEDFVCLIYQDKCSCVVSVEATDNQQQDVGCYFPQENESVTFGSFVVTCMKFQNKYNHQYRKLKIQNNGKQAAGERIVNHYQYTNWKNTEKVPSSEADFVQFINDAQSSVQEDGLSPILLHCLTGGKKCGLFCTVSLLLERADIIRQISVVNTVRLLRLRRPNVIPNKEQLKFAHQCVASKMEMLNTYSNFSLT